MSRAAAVSSLGIVVALACATSCMTPKDLGHDNTVVSRAERPESSGPASSPDMSKPDARGDLLGPPYRLDIDTIIQLIFERSAKVTSSREEMRAAEFGLEEFRANLSRLEPFVESRADVSDFPNRSDAFGNQVEAVVGVQKETFEGAVLRTEVGGAYSRFEFGDLAPGRQTEEGDGVLMRTRLEAPFFGSRRRQNRVIAQAFQESTARRAQLDYLDDYREYVDDALSYYISAVYYTRLAAAYQKSIDDFEQLLEDERIGATDRRVIEAQRSASEFQRDEYLADAKESRTILLAELDLAGRDDVEIRAVPYRLSRFAEEARTKARLEQLIERARENNPTFTVLADAIANTELQREQAIHGSFDVTTFLEGTIFPLGSKTFDDRLDGWSVGGGVVVRLNDRRVLNATRLKAEAEIRQFEAKIRSEEINMRRRITTETRGLLDNHTNRQKLLETRRQRDAVWQNRRSGYFEGQVNVDQVLEARKDVRSTDVDLAQNTYSSESRERRLMGALGLIYDAVGLDVGDQPADG